MYFTITTEKEVPDHGGSELRDGQEVCRLSGGSELRDGQEVCRLCAEHFPHKAMLDEHLQ